MEAALRLSPLSAVSFSARMDGETDGELWLLSNSGLTEVVMTGPVMTEVTDVTRGGLCGFFGHRLR